MQQDSFPSPWGEIKQMVLRMQQDCVKMQQGLGKVQQNYEKMQQVYGKMQSMNREMIDELRTLKDNSSSTEADHHTEIDHQIRKISRNSVLSSNWAEDSDESEGRNVDEISSANSRSDDSLEVIEVNNSVLQSKDSRMVILGIGNDDDVTISDDGNNDRNDHVHIDHFNDTLEYDLHKSDTFGGNKSFGTDVWDQEMRKKKLVSLFFPDTTVISQVEMELKSNIVYERVQLSLFFVKMKSTPFCLMMLKGVPNQKCMNKKIRRELVVFLPNATDSGTFKMKERICVWHKWKSKLLDHVVPDGTCFITLDGCRTYMFIVQVRSHGAQFVCVSSGAVSLLKFRSIKTAGESCSLSKEMWEFTNEEWVSYQGEETNNNRAVLGLFNCSFCLGIPKILWKDHPPNHDEKECVSSWLVSWKWKTDIAQCELQELQLQDSQISWPEMNNMAGLQEHGDFSQYGSIAQDFSHVQVAIGGFKLLLTGLHSYWVVNKGQQIVLNGSYVVWIAKPIWSSGDGSPNSHWLLLYSTYCCSFKKGQFGFDTFD